MQPETTHILLVEDDNTHVELIRRAVEGYDMHLHVVGTLEAAKAYVQKDRCPDIIFADFLLPDGHGTDVLEHVRVCGECCPVVILTSHGSEAVAVEALKAGAIDYVVKSSTVFADMPTIVRRVIREWGHIEKRRQAEMELKESERKFRKMFEVVSDGIVLVDMYGNIVLFNKTAELMFGYDREEILHRSLDLLLPEDVQRILIAQTTTLVGLEGLRKDGSTFPIDCRLTPLEVENKRMVMYIITDVSARRQLEEERLYSRTLELELEKERELIELKDSFMRLVSHQFRTPLAVIQSSAELIGKYADKLNPERMEAHISKIGFQVQNMIEMMNDFLLFNRARAGKLDCQPEEIDLHTFFENMLDTYRMLDDGFHEISMHVDPLPDRVVLDPTLLEHIFSNLVSNALKYSAEPGSRVSLTIRAETDALRFDVEDEGIGIPPEDQPQIFEPFHRARNSHGVNGTGFGLVVAKQCAEAHGGTLSFASVEGEGTTFTVVIPISV